VTRSAEDLYDNRETYLKLAEKRKRLTFKIRDVAKKAAAVNAFLSTPGFSTGIELGDAKGMVSKGNSESLPSPGRSLGGPSPVTSSRPRRAVLNRASTPELDPEGSPMPKIDVDALDFAAGPWQGPASVSNTAIRTPSPGGLPPPGGGGLLQAPKSGSNRRSVLRGAADGAPSPEPSLPVPPPSIAGRRRGSPAPYKSQLSVGGGSGLTTEEAASSAGANGVDTLTTPTTNTDNTPTPTTTGNVTTPSWTISPSTAFDSPFFDAPFPSDPLPVSPAPLLKEETTTDQPSSISAEEVLKLANLGVNAANVLRDSRAPVFSFGGHFMCVRERGTGPQATKIAITVITIAGAKRARYPFQAESAVLNGDPLLPLIGCYALSGVGSDGPGVLQVYDIENRKGVSQQPIATQMLYWRWVMNNRMALVTPRAVFHWSIKEGGPQKIFDQRDGWGDMDVVDYHLSGDAKWALLTLQKKGGLFTTYIHSMQAHRTFKEIDILAADVGRFKPEDPLQLLLLKPSHQGPGYMLELYDLPQQTQLTDAPVSPTSLSSLSTPVSSVTLHSGSGTSGPQRVSILFPNHPTKHSVSFLTHESSLLFNCTVDGGKLQPPSCGTFLGPGKTVRDVSINDEGDLLVLEEGLVLWKVPTT